MKVVHGLERAETMTMEREERGSLTVEAGSVGLYFRFAKSSWDSLQNWDDGGHDSHHSYQDYGVGGGGFHGHKKRLVASDPSPHVIFLGLDTAFTESDVRGDVRNYPFQG